MFGDNPNKILLIAITGGIGAGKSIVSKILLSMGYVVYDTDTRAKQIMGTSIEIERKLKETFGNEIYINGQLDRVKLSKIVFNDSENLKKLNSIVHPAVINDIKDTVNQLSSMKSQTANQPFFIETALLYQSGLDKIVDKVWEVSAPEQIRVRRVMKRNNLSFNETVSRILSQKYTPASLHSNVSLIINDDRTPLIPQVLRLLKTV